MKIEHAKYFLPFIQAIAEGKTVEYRVKDSSSKFIPLLPIADWFTDDDFEVREFRIKPELKWRPWRAEEVPLGCWLKMKEGVGDEAFALVVVLNHGVYLGLGGIPPHQHSFARLLKEKLHSTDHGKTWNPCGVLE